MLVGFGNIIFSPLASQVSIDFTNGPQACSIISFCGGSKHFLKVFALNIFSKQKSFHYSCCVHAQELCVVTTFLHYENLVTDLGKLVRHPEIHHRAELRPPNRVPNTSIKPTANNDQIRIELLGNRQKKILASMLVLI